MKKLFLSVLVVALLAGFVPVWAESTVEQAAFKTVSAEIQSALAGKSEFARKIGGYSNFYRDLIKVLKKHGEAGMPKALKFNGKTVKILVPLNLDEKRVGGFFQVSADGKKVLSYIVWKKNLEPLFVVAREKWEKAASADLLPEVKELVPLKEGHSAGVPVSKSDLTDLYLIDYVDQLPSKTQEEIESYTSKNGLKSTLGRRTASSKCLSYSASLASDWWNIAQGNKIGSYDSFVNGAREYGMNPRIVESLYFMFPKCPYTFIKETGHDRVTGEKIAYSPKHYAYIMSSIDLEKTITDPLKKSNVYKLPKNGFGMDLPFCNSFNKSHGKVEKIRQDLEKYGIMYSQHTSRLFKDKVSLTLQGVHSVNIVGTAKLKGEPVVIYYETFGKNDRDYIEDSYYGPSLRAFPVKFFYQGIFFPHRIISQVKIEKDIARISFKTHAGKKIVPENIQVFVNGKEMKTKRGAFISVPLGSSEANLKIKYSRRYYYTPEESNGYERNYIVSGKNLIEIKQYESILKTLADRKGGLFKKVFGKADSYTDHLAKQADVEFSTLKKKLMSIRNDSKLLQNVAAEISKSKVLAKSDLNKVVKEMLKFQKLNSNN